LIYGSIGGSLEVAALQDPQVIGRVETAFRVAFLGAAVLCALAAWTASRVPSLRFDKELRGVDTVGE
jgi:hypothetical protein